MSNEILGVITVVVREKDIRASYVLSDGRCLTEATDEYSNKTAEQRVAELIVEARRLGGAK